MTLIKRLDLIEETLLGKLRQTISQLKYPSVEAFDVLEVFIKAHNELATNEDDIKICNIMDNKSLIEVMSKCELFNARIIGELYGLLERSNINTPFFLYNCDLIVNDIELVTTPYIEKITNVLFGSLKKIMWEALEHPENPTFTPIYRIIFKSVLSS